MRYSRQVLSRFEVYICSKILIEEQKNITIIKIKAKILQKAETRIDTQIALCFKNIYSSRWLMS